MLNIRNMFRPRPTLSDADVAHGLRMMTLEGIASVSMFSVTTSGLLAAYALALGANNFQVGILAGLPFITQLLQIPAVVLVERLRWRKAIAVVSWLPAQLMWVFVALIPFFVGVPSSTAVAMLLGFVALRGVFNAATTCAWNSWVRDLVPQKVLGSFFSRRLAFGTTGAIVFGLAGALFVDYWRNGTSDLGEVLGYSYVLLAGAIFLGLSSPLFMSQMPEPSMPPPAQRQPSLWQMLSTPLRDQNFRQLVNFLLFWGFAANLAIPFFTIYMLSRLHFPLTAVIALNMLSQLTNVLFLRVWGRLTDRFGSKAILSASASLYLLVILGWAFTTLPERYLLTVPLVIVLQVFAGVAAAGVNLTIGTIGLKLAPQGQATSYMAAASLATHIGAGLGPFVGGLFADFFAVRQLNLTFEWIDPSRSVSFPAVHLTGFDFLFVIAFVIGFFTLNTLTTIREEGEVGREVILDELLAPTREVVRSLGAVPVARFVGEFSYAYLRRFPGLDVALGVTGYQVASTVRTAIATASRGGETATDIASRVSSALSGIAEQATELSESGVELALHTTRGALNAAGEAAAEVGILAKGAILGLARVLAKTTVNPRDVLRGAGYGTVQGAEEAGVDVAVSVAHAVEGAREAARELGLSEEEAVAVTAQGILEAAEASGPETAAQVKEALGGRGPKP